jgi:hypothetical protein
VPTPSTLGGSGNANEMPSYIWYPASPDRKDAVTSPQIAPSLRGLVDAPQFFGLKPASVIEIRLDTCGLACVIVEVNSWIGWMSRQNSTDELRRVLDN